MRTTKELLELMLENQQFFKSGLCRWIENMYRRGIITEAECYRLEYYLSQNKPITFYKILRMNNNRYWWRIGDIKPRIKWIEKHIKKLS
jgi:hypothetical protein